MSYHYCMHKELLFTNMYSYLLTISFILILRAPFNNAAPNLQIFEMLLKNNTNRVVGGMDIPEGQFVPYQVSMQYFTKSGEYKHFCGGSIISPSHILTAAHCCQGLNVSRMSVLAGVRDLKKANTGQRSLVQSYDIHENYEELVTSDIAIVFIDPPLVLDNVSTAAVNVGGAERVGGGVLVTLTGWGLRLPIPFPFLPEEWENLNYPNILQSMTYTTTTNWECQASGMTDLTDTELCAIGLGLKGACSGDSGGPLVMNDGGSLKQVGIVSYGLVICGVFEVPDVYTRVSMFDYWIKERIKQAMDNENIY